MESRIPPLQVESLIVGDRPRRARAAHAQNVDMFIYWWEFSKKYSDKT